MAEPRTARGQRGSGCCDASYSILLVKVRSPVTGGHVFTLDTKLDKESEFVRFGPGIKVSFSPL